MNDKYIDVSFIGDMAIYFDDNGQFKGMDFIHCGEWLTYTREDIEEVKFILHKYNIDIALS